MTTGAGHPPLGVFGIVGESFRVLFKHFRFLFPLAFFPALVITLIDTATTGGATGPDGMPDIGAGDLLALLLSATLGFAVTAVMCLAAIDALIDKRHSLNEYIGQALRHLGPIIVTGVAISLAAGIGLVLFIVPGLYILARYLPWVQAVVFENAGWSGLSRSQELTQGYRWPLVGALLLLGAVIVAFGVAVSPILAATAGAGGFGIAGILFASLFSGLYYAYTAIFTSLIYVRLREIHEGMSIHDIGALIE